MPMGSCYNLRKHISDYLDNKLDPELQVLVERHLKTCPECSRSAKHIGLLRKRLASLRRYQCPETFTHKLNQRIHAPHSAFSMALPMRKFSYALGIILLVFLSVYTMQWINNRPEEVVIPPSSLIEPANQEASPLTNTDQQDVDIKTKESLADQDDSLSTQKNSDGRIKYVDGNK
jgi:predicted anti-sigma-YlaC factor YlaD